MLSIYLKSIGIVFILLLASCEEEPLPGQDPQESSCGDFVLLDEAAYKNSNSDPLTILSTALIGDCLEITFSSGGCDGNSWKEQLIDSEQVLESFPPQKRLKFVLENDEACFAMITKTIYFDLTTTQLIDYQEIILNIDGYSRSILYNYSLQKQVEGEWNLINVNGGFAGTNNNFQIGDILWDFENDHVDILNNNPQMNPIYDGIESGQYQYSIDQTSNQMRVGEFNLGHVDIRSDSLIIDQRAIDGFQLVFTKSNKIQRLNGAWNLLDVSCECMPPNLVEGDHTWVFDAETKQLEVQNKVDKPLQILETGTYFFEIDNQTIEIKDVEYEYYYVGEHLIIEDHPEVDGPMMKFKRK